MLPLCRSEGVGVMPWSPLARGRLTRDWNQSNFRTQTDDAGNRMFGSTLASDKAVVEAVAKVAAARGVPRAQVALAWVVRQPGVTSPIVGASKIEHLSDAVAALDLVLEPDELRELEESYVPHAVAGFE